ncbi:MAG: efflux RND transporter periplasmic adaptor subunit [Lentisphaeria bacterium]|nr:efflux RND transporter periplasmic adaptor subunit [Lentisphaeria bacterium]MDP7741637.1 efflux RND transporter periplasmic adaptor subunit [Lentisphaeria bacterium]
MSSSSEPSPSRPDASRPPAPLGRPPVGLLAWRLVVVAAILGAGWFGVRAIMAGKKAPAQAVLVARVPTVEVVTCAPQTETIILYGHGTVETATRTAIRPQVGGRVLELHERLEPGEIIERGEVLVRLDAEDYVLSRDVNQAGRGRLQAEIALLNTETKTTAARLELAQQSTALSEAEFKRLQVLLTEEQIGTRSSVDRAEHAVVQDRERMAQLQQSLAAIPHRIAALEAELAQLERRVAVDELALARCTIKAPFSGRVERVAVEANDVVQIGATLLSLADDSDLEIAVSLNARDVNEWMRFRPETDSSAPAGWFGLIEEVPATVAWLEGDADAAWPGTVARVKQFDDRSRMVTVVIRPGAASGTAAYPLIPGMFCAVEIRGKQIPGAYRIPRAALNESDRVFIVVDNVLKSRHVHVAREIGEELIVDDGLAPGDQVVVSRLRAPADGLAVRIRQRDGQRVALPPTDPVSDVHDEAKPDPAM